jgi:hypothetical protein
MKRAFAFSLVFVFVLASTSAAAPGDTLWTKVYGGEYNESAFSVQQTTDGGYVVVGYSYTFGPGNYDVYLLKMDANGDTSWTRTYGGTDGDYGYSVQQTTDGGYVIAGNTDSFGGANDDMFLVKTDTDGDTMWTRTYDGPGGYELAYYVQQTTDGGYIIAGYTYFVGTSDRDVFLVKTDGDGETLWTRSYGGDAADIARSAQQTTDGGYILAGYSESFGGGNGVAWLIKTDANGDTLWTRIYEGVRGAEARSVQQTTDGGYIVGGHTDPWGGTADIYLIKIDPNGQTEWTRTHGGRNDDYGHCVQETADGGYIVTGYTWSFGAGWYDVCLLRTDAKGKLMWWRTYGGEADDHGQFVCETGDGNFILAGSTRSFGAGAGDVYLLKVAGEERAGLSIEIVPDDPPVTVPQGGSFGFTATLTNETGEPKVAEAWTMAIDSEGRTYGPLKASEGLGVAPYQSRSAHFNQTVSNLAPLGFYNYVAYCGDYPSTVVDSSFFQVEVIAGATGGGGWVLTGSFLQGDLAKLPADFALLGNYPNPFNASTQIRYELPTGGNVKLEVFNVLGKKVATLVNGVEGAGYKSITWDACDVSSGLYFYKLTAGDLSETKRMLLVK